MTKGRLEAFSDAIIAIIMTIMVLEFKVPHEPTLEALGKLAPTFGCYIVSYIYLGIYWNNHHHMLQAVRKVSGAVLWANLHLLFWLSLVPFATAWLADSHFAMTPAAVYGVILFGAGMAYYVLAQLLIRANGPESPVAKAIGRDKKGVISVVIYALAIATAFVSAVAACALYVVVAGIWLIPDRRIEAHLDLSSGE